MEPSKEPGDQKNREYFKRQKLPLLRSYLLERGIQISSDGKNKRKAEVVYLAVNAHEMKLAKVCDGKSEDVNTLIAELLTADEGFLPNPVLVLNWRRNLSLFPEVTFPDICKWSPQNRAFGGKLSWLAVVHHTVSSYLQDASNVS